MVSLAMLYQGVLPIQLVVILIKLIQLQLNTIEFGLQPWCIVALLSDSEEP
jgi:hypothetical protein